MNERIPMLVDLPVSGQALRICMERGTRSQTWVTKADRAPISVGPRVTKTK